MENSQSELDLSISIVNYNTAAETNKLINSIYNSTKSINYEILLVDNASKEPIDDIVNKYPDVKVIQNSKNLFFTKADNQNLTRAKGKYIVSINSDAFVLQDALNVMINCLDTHPFVGAVTPKIIYPDGVLQRSLGEFVTLGFGFCFASGLPRFYPNIKAFTDVMPNKITYDPDSMQEAKLLYGACIMVRREVLETVGLKDENLIHGWDEYDWCKRMTQHGWKLLYAPGAVITHSRGASRDKLETCSESAKLLDYYSWQGFFYLYKKYYGIHVYLMLKIVWHLNNMLLTCINSVRSVSRQLTSVLKNDNQ